MRLNVVPKAPGFVSAHWLEPIDGVGMSIIVLESKEHADKAVAYPLPLLPGVTPLKVEIREVYASARRVVRSALSARGPCAAAGNVV